MEPFRPYATFEPVLSTALPPTPTRAATRAAPLQQETQYSTCITTPSSPSRQCLTRAHPDWELNVRKVNEDNKKHWKWDR